MYFVVKITHEGKKREKERERGQGRSDNSKFYTRGLEREGGQGRSDNNKCKRVRERGDRVGLIIINARGLEREGGGEQGRSDHSKCKKVES